jgi:plastocyanin
LWFSQMILIEGLSFRLDFSSLVVRVSTAMGGIHRSADFILLLLCLAATPASLHADKVVAASDYKFTPAETKILVGEKVTWINSGGTHNVSSTQGLFRNEIAPTGWQFSFTFNTPGTFSYVCQQHSGGYGYGALNMSGSVQVRESNAPPTVTVVSPGAGALFAANDLATLSVNAQDDGLVDQVEFFDGTASLGAVRTNPFNLTLILPPGSHSISAKATDDNGAVAISQPVDFQVSANHRPVVSISEPAAETYINLPGTVTFKVQATDADGTIAKVDYFNQIYTGEVKPVGTAVSAPFDLPVTSLDPGVGLLTAIVTDNGGLSRTSAPVRFYVSNRVRLTFVPRPAGYLGISTGPIFGKVTLQLNTDLRSANWVDYEWGAPGGGALEFQINPNLPKLFFRTKVEPGRTLVAKDLAASLPLINCRGSKEFSLAICTN